MDLLSIAESAAQHAAAWLRAVPVPRHPADWTVNGRNDGFWELQLAPWDVAAGALLVREAGGVVTDLEGRDLRLGHGPVVAGSPAIPRGLLATLSQDSRP